MPPFCLTTGVQKNFRIGKKKSMKSILYFVSSAGTSKNWGNMGRFKVHVPHIESSGFGVPEERWGGEGKSYVSGQRETKDSGEHPKFNLGIHQYQYVKPSSWLYILSPYLSIDWFPCPEGAALLCTESNYVNSLILVSALVLLPNSFPVQSSPQ